MNGHATPAGRSVLDDLGLDAGYVVKAKLALRIQKTVAEMGLTRREAACGRSGMTSRSGRGIQASAMD